MKEISIMEKLNFQSRRLIQGKCYSSIHLSHLGLMKLYTSRIMVVIKQDIINFHTATIEVYEGQKLKYLLQCFGVISI